MRVYPAVALSWSPGLGAEFLEQLVADLDGFGLIAVEELPSGARVFFASSGERDRAHAALAGRDDLTADLADVPDEDWAERSQAAIGPVTVGRITVAPPWSVTDELRARSPDLVVIQPSMGFGTAHHASTRLCLRLLQGIDLGGRSVLDIGTGSGVLAIAAIELGARQALGIDIDADALASAREDVELNQMDGRVQLREGDLNGVMSLGQRFDVVLANLTGALLCRSAGALFSLIAGDGRLIASGFETHERADVVGALIAAGLTHVDTMNEDGWVGVVLTRAST